jgi:hypothetical protein
MWKYEIKNINSDCTELTTVAELTPEVEDDGSPAIPSGSVCAGRRKQFTR